MKKGFAIEEQIFNFLQDSCTEDVILRTTGAQNVYGCSVCARMVEGARWRSAGFVTLEKKLSASVGDFFLVKELQLIANAWYA